VAIGFYLPLGRVLFTLVRGLPIELTRAFHARFVRYRDAGVVSLLARDDTSIALASGSRVATARPARSVP
jgi:hypothetical protein